MMINQRTSPLEAPSVEHSANGTVQTLEGGGQDVDGVGCPKHE
jgi:hypothetical protein